MHVFELGGVDLILGIAWLAKLGEMVINWWNMSMQYIVAGEKMMIKGDPALARQLGCRCGSASQKNIVAERMSVNCPYLRMTVLQCLPLPIPNSLLCPPSWLLAVSPQYLFLSPVRLVFYFACYNWIFAYLETMLFKLFLPNFFSQIARASVFLIQWLVTMLYCAPISCDQIKFFPYILLSLLHGWLARNSCYYKYLHRCSSYRLAWWLYCS